jgi:choline dehydrogenase
MQKSYDYIIVGAGAAGCVLAYRLSEDRTCNVLLLEAGGRDWHPLLKLPIAWALAMVTPQFNWGYMAEPEPQLGGRDIALARGKMLGGSTSINGMRYSRGHPRDYDQWRQMGNEGWGYADVLPYFKRSEKNFRGENKYHGGDGPLNVQLATAPQLLYPPLAASAKSAGFVESEDIHGDVTEGITRAEITVNRFGRRHSTAKAFLKPAMKRKNLTVITGALTTRVRIENGRAVGVDYVRAGHTVNVRAAREVILAGGAYNSPQLLMLSGIGPADELRAHGIAPLIDLPGVGKNLAEHPLVSVVMETREPFSFLRHLRMDRAALWTARWLFTGGGAFAVSGNTAGLFARTRPELERPDVQLLYSALPRDSQLWWPGQAGRQKFAVQCSISLQHPDALGDVTLRSADPADPPRIFLNLFGAQSDIDTVIRGIRMAREIYAHEPMASLIKAELLPGADVTSNAELKDFVLRMAATTQHPCGTCKMGGDDQAVVDNQLRVRGVTALRVADASIMPTIPGGHINAPTIMIGEKAADLIRGRSLAPAVL